MLRKVEFMRQRPGKPSARNRTLRLALCLLALRGAATAQTDAPPDAVEQERILTMMRQYAASYRMPDVAFDQTITGFKGSAGSNQWHQEWTGDSMRIAHGGREYWCCRIGRNGKPLAGAKWEAAFLYTFSEFEGLAGKATVVWDRWDTLRSRRFAVFHYSVSQQDSQWGMDSTSEKDSNWTWIKSGAYVPYSGSIYVDPATGAIWRMSDVVTDLPARFKTRYASGTTDYDEVAIGTTRYMLPITKSVVTRRGPDRRDDWAYRNYHKFDADSSITFFGTDSSITYKK
jgi:hypothetical protein